MSTHAVVLGAVFALVVSVAAPATAKECVNPKGNKGCFATVQGAIDNATAGETIVVRPGIYKETFDVNKANVTIVGGGRKPGAVQIDGGQSGDAVLISADGVTVKNLTVRNGGDSLFNITGANASLVKVHMFGAFNSDGVNSVGANTRIVKCRVMGTEGDCIYGSGDGLYVANTRVMNCSSGCLEAGGANARFLNNRAWICENDEGIYVSGDNAVVKGNKVTGSSEQCIYVNGNGAKVVGNDVTACEYDGIYVDGNDPVVNGNTSVGTSESGFEIYGATSLTFKNNKAMYNNDIQVDLDCSTCTGSGTVTGNLAKYGVEDDDGFEIDGSGGGTFLVQENKALYIQDYGFDITSDGTTVFTVRKNVARQVGGDHGEIAFSFSNTDNAMIMGNSATEVLGYGFYFNSVDNATVSNNKAGICTNDGFNLRSPSSGNTLSNNTASKCVDYGFFIEAGADNNTLNNNTAVTNNTDFCDNGTGTSTSGNNFGSTCP